MGLDAEWAQCGSCWSWDVHMKSRKGTWALSHTGLSYKWISYLWYFRKDKGSFFHSYNSLEMPKKNGHCLYKCGNWKASLCYLRTTPVRSRPLLPAWEKQAWSVRATQHSFPGHVTQSLLLKGVLHTCMTSYRRTNPSHPSLCFLDLTQLTGWSTKEEEARTSSSSTAATTTKSCGSQSHGG